MRREDFGIDGYATLRPRSSPASSAALEPEFVRDPSFLTGAAGIALALAGGVAASDPGWDRSLLASG